MDMSTSGKEIEIQVFCLWTLGFHEMNKLPNFWIMESKSLAVLPCVISIGNTMPPKKTAVRCGRVVDHEAVPTEDLLLQL